jgi:hypothetical protein
MLYFIAIIAMTDCQRDVAMTTRNQKLDGDRGAKLSAAAVEAHKKRADARAAPNWPPLSQGYGRAA